jgi:hypothetical protein
MKLWLPLLLSLAGSGGSRQRTDVAARRRTTIQGAGALPVSVQGLNSVLSFFFTATPLIFT